MIFISSPIKSVISYMFLDFFTHMIGSCLFGLIVDLYKVVKLI